MINSELQMLSGGAGYETQVALYLLLLETVLVLLVIHPDPGDRGQNSCTYKNKKAVTALNC